LYKGRRRSHRFTILGDTAFEYDCVLEREPESNIISLRMEGAEKFDFLRQPDFLKEPLLAGSYAVYKKETLIGEGTGKLCHIHRPEIIDARGRRCWGDLSVDGNELRITIPEWWLGEAKYPVVVDPTIGTTTVGSQTYCEDYEDDLYFEIAIPVNRFLVTEAINGLCTAYIYTNSDDGVAYGYPVFYSDNDNKPQYRKSMDEQLINLRVINGNQKGWRSGTLKNNGSIASGTYIWFGVFTKEIWYPRYDFGAKCYLREWEYDTQSIPDIYPISIYDYYQDYRLSMYFTYSSAQNYLRTLTQGISLTDNGNKTGSYFRRVTQNIIFIETIKTAAGFYRNVMQSVMAVDILSMLNKFIRSVFNRIILNEIFTHKRRVERKCEDTTVLSSDLKREPLFLKVLSDNLKLIDERDFIVLFVRKVIELSGITDILKNVWAYIRVLFDEVRNIAKMLKKSNYNRNERDAVQVSGFALRYLSALVRILTFSFVRDYVIRRFLIAREELVLKSVISCEIILESKIN